MTENKNCWTCKFRDVDFSVKPCSECDDLLRNKWKEREK